MTRARKQAWGNDPVLYAQAMNAWLDTNDAAQEAAFMDRIGDPAADLVREQERDERHIGPRFALEKAASRLRQLPARSRIAAKIRLRVQQLLRGRDDLYQYWTTLEQAKRGPGNKSRGPRQAPDLSILEGDPWAAKMRSPEELAEYAKIAQQQEAEFVEYSARETVDIYKRIKQRHRELRFRRSPHDGLPDDMEIAAERALRPPADAEMILGEMTAAQRRAADEGYRDFRAKVITAARNFLHGDAPGARRGRKRRKPGDASARKKKAPKASASGA